MRLDEYRTRPAWPIYEQLLIDQGWAPCWTPEVEALVVATSIACPDCRQLPAYIGMRKATLALAFLVCGSHARAGHGSGRAPLEHARVVSVLHNPHYAGAYFFGRTHSRPGPDARVVTTQRAREQWLVFIPGAHPGYIDWETFEANQARLAANVRSPGVDRSAGPAREGTALLQGLAICARCGRRMRVGYHLRGGVERPTYLCSFDSQQKGAPLCQSIPGSAVDSAVAELALDALTPLALEAALSVQAEIQSRAAEADALRRRHVEAARYRADLARRRYLGVDPANRLVADTLEADWNEALATLNDAQEGYERASAAAGASLSDEQIARVRALAGDVPALWSNPATPPRERKRIIRLLIDDVTLNKTDAVHVHVRFRGGQTASLSLPLPVPYYELHRTPADTLALVNRLLDDHTDGEVAEMLNRDGHRSGTGVSFDVKKVVGLRRTHGLPTHAERLRAKGLVSRSEVAAAFGVSASTISKWRARDLLVAYRANDHNDMLYELPAGADPAKLGRSLSRLRTSSRR
jgi:hypothetical protein